MMARHSRIFVAGHRGLVGSAILRRLQALGYDNLILRTHGELDLIDASAVEHFFAAEQPEYIFLAAARVGGIVANSTFGADFLRENLQVQVNVIDAAYRHGAKKLLFLGSSCIYPKLALQPIREDSLLSGPLEPTNEPYAIAKIAGISMCKSYRQQYGFDAISLMPTNLYGPNDNFDLTSSHVLPGLLRKIHEAKLCGAPNVTVWGSGTPRREFLYVDDMADACVFLMDAYSSGEILNVGVGDDVTIADLARIICDIVGYSGDLVFDQSKPDGTPRKLLDVSRLTASGWTARTSLRDGIAATYSWYLDNSVSSSVPRGVARQ